MTLLPTSNNCGKVKMSTFSGKLDEIPFISVDRFDAINLQYDAFFLTHCHTDHMKGIYNPWDRREFIDELKKRNDVYIYMSRQSKAILDKWMYNLKHLTRGLDMYEENCIDIPSKGIKLRVSLLPAGHCPGSVMFLFNTDKNVLYTGDIRLQAKDLKKYKVLYKASKELKKIDHIYLDTTFFSKKYMDFPNRDESIQECIKVIKNWISVSPKHVICIDTPANYGSEALFIEIYKACKMPIRVKPEKYDMYKHFPEMDNVFIKEFDNIPTQIHNTCNSFFSKNCRKGIYTKQIKPCALSWERYEFGNDVKRVDNGTTKICYSSHCSYNELREIIKFLKPSQITACVESGCCRSLIKEILNEIKNEIEDSSSSSFEQFDDILDWTKPSLNSHMINNSDPENSDFGFLDSPETERKRYKKS